MNYVLLFCNLFMKTTRQQTVSASISTRSLNAVNKICLSVCFIKQTNVTQEFSGE